MKRKAIDQPTTQAWTQGFVAGKFWGQNDVPVSFNILKKLAKDCEIENWLDFVKGAWKGYIVAQEEWMRKIS